MDLLQKRALALYDTDVQGAIRRFSGNEQLYVSCLLMFLEDPTMVQLTQAIGKESWDDAFTAAHALKGLSGNLGLVPLMHSSSQLVISIRSGHTSQIDELIAQVSSDYLLITDAIRSIFLSPECEGR